MTVQAKAVINAYYNSAPKYSYFNGCSLGGRQGITEAQRYPADYDGIVAGALAWGGMRVIQLTAPEDRNEIPTTKVRKGKVTITVSARGELQGGNSEVLTAPMVGGDLPINTHGGQLSEAYIIGMTHVTEAVEQVRGTAINQVADCEFALVTGGPAPIPISGLILRSA